MMAIALGSLIVNLLGMGAVTQRQVAGNLNVHGAWLHMMTDAVGTLAAIGAGGLIWAFGWEWADPVASILIGILVIYSSWALIKEAIAILMESTPTHLDIEAVRAALAAGPGVREVHDLHAWTITSGMISLSAHVIVADEQSPPVALRAIREILHERFGLDHVTIQIETEGDCGCSIPNDGGCVAAVLPTDRRARRGQQPGRGGYKQKQDTHPPEPGCRPRCAWAIRSFRARRSALTASLLGRQNSQQKQPREKTGRCSGRRNDHVGKPELAQVTNDLQKLVQGHRFGDVAFDLEMLGPQNLLVNSRCGQHDDRDVAELLVVFDFLEQFAPPFFWQFQIQQDQVRTRSSDKTTLAGQKLHGLFTVTNQGQAVFDLAVTQRFDR